MPFPMKIQPIDPTTFATNKASDHVQIKPPPKSRLKRLFEKQFPGVLRNNSSEKLAGAGEAEVGTICLDKMVINFLEENGDAKGKCGRSRCNCFNGNCGDSSDDDDFAISGDPPAISSSEATDLIKGLVVCATVSERNLLADVATLVDKHKICKRTDELRKIVADGLRSNGYDASICKSRWDKSASFPAGEYEYIDVVFKEGDRVIVEVDFRSEFEIARSTKGYRALLQSLPSIFVGKEDRLQQIVAVASEAARLSLKKKGLSFPPWRKPEYMRNKWLSPYERSENSSKSDSEVREEIPAVNLLENKKPTAMIGWEPPPVKPKAIQSKPKVTGLASMLREKI
ncbi:DUF506 family protein (DUF506) [Rhynchospora pubera]|uniref:DUF506 family protein (DUF506) n=1 Tax=Rhynchospora pubera TaxID=906938 RepID=A0AAV8FT27_9POAL|nr:DUF506 family protein (DUF506) [Rhynchospora pubera]KAJ4796402.1 DUF506 family protein (DUF506) [Rhynchospora pubera]